MKNTNLGVVILVVYMFAVVVVTAPSTTATVEKSFFAFNRIKLYFRSTQRQEKQVDLNSYSLRSSCFFM
jgi:hypothetical protein